MIERAIAAEVPFAWVAADTVYGVGDIELRLRRAGKGYVLGVKTDHVFSSWIGKPEMAGTAETIADRLPASAWTRLSAGEARRAHGSTTGPLASWPTSTGTNTARPVCGRAVC